MKIKTYKMEYPDNQEYYNLDKILTINADVYFIMSIRDLGKSYDARKKLVKSMKNGFNNAWLRWDRTETATANDKFATSEDLIKSHIPNSNIGFVIDDNDNKTYFLSVKSAMSYKDFGIDNLKFVVYDECVPEHYDIRTRRETEFKKLMSLYDTIKRDSNARLIMICNCIDWFNPFTAGWEIYPFNSGLAKLFIRKMNIDGKDYEMKICVENVKPTKAMIERVARLQVLKGNYKTVQDYFKNVTTTQYHLIEICPNRKIPLRELQFRLGNDYYSFRQYSHLFYFCKTKKRDNLETESPDIHDIRKGEYRTVDFGLSIEQLINNGNARFDNGHTYNAIMKMVYKYRERL